MAALASSALPGLLVQLHQQGFEGWLQLENGGIKRRFLWQGGVPTRLDSNDDGDALVERLIRREVVPEDARQAFRREVARKPAPELVVLVTLKLAVPKDLLAGLSEQLQDTFLHCMTWDHCQVELEPGSFPGAKLPQAPVDVLVVAAEGVARNWRPDQVLQALGNHATHFPSANSKLEPLKARLAESAGSAALLENLEGKESAFNLLRRLADPHAYATLWLLHTAGVLKWSEQSTAEPAAGQAGAQEESAAPELAPLEIVIEGKQEAVDNDEQDSAASQAKDKSLRRSSKLRRQILEMHAKLEEIDYWQLLEIERDALPAKIKKAYLKKAKRLHPDMAAQLGLEDVKTEANELFAAIARAHEVLTDPDERRAYEAQLEGHTTVDANSLAQAEMLFQKGEVLMKSGNFIDAFEFLDASVELWPEEADYQACLAWTLFKKSPPDDARSIECFEKAISLDGENALTHMRFSVVLKATGNTSRSKQEAERARQIDPSVRV